MLPQSNRRNGHNNVGITGPDYNDPAFTIPSSSSAIKEYVHSGNSMVDLAMRCNFQNVAEKNAAVLYARRLDEFHMDKHKENFIFWLAASDSINAERIRKLTTAIIGHWPGEKTQPGRRLFKRYQESNTPTQEDE